MAPLAATDRLRGIYDTSTGSIGTGQLISDLGLVCFSLFSFLFFPYTHTATPISLPGAGNSWDFTYRAPGPTANSFRIALVDSIADQHIGKFCRLSFGRQICVGTCLDRPAFIDADIDSLLPLRISAPSQQSGLDASLSNLTT